MPMVKALLVGNGAREHAIASSLVKSGAELYSFMKARNPGIYRMSKSIEIGDINNPASVSAFGSKIGADFAFIGPEAPLNAGVADALVKEGVPCVGPMKALAQLECSKSFTRKLIEKYRIPCNPKFRIFSDKTGLREFAEELGGLVVKPDGLTGGKGVKVSGEHLKTVDEVVAYSEEVLKGGDSVILEEKLVGEEFTLQCFVDGKRVVGMPLVQDHKRAYEGDEGPNTGGMGSYSDADHLLPFVKKEQVDEALKMMEKTVSAANQETGLEYKGILYGQFMLTKNGPKLIEYNSRFGDPEAMNVLTLLESDFAEVCQNIIDGSLGEVKFANKASVCKYLVPEGYPASPEKDRMVSVDEEAIEDAGARVFYASVYEKDGGIYTTGSRSVGVVGIADSLEEAERIAELSTEFVKGNLFHRKDIGTPELVKSRVEHMKIILS